MLKKILYLLFLNFTSVFLYTQEINHLGVEDGLSGRQTFNIIQDQNKFIWISTRFGIDRYDGVNIKRYKIDIMHNGPIPIRFLKVLLDNNKQVWAYTDRGLIYRYDSYQDSFIPDINFNKFIKYVNFDNNNRIWVATHKDLGYRDENSLVFIKSRLSKDESYKSIACLNPNELLIQTNKNLYNYDIQNDKFSPLLNLNEQISIESYYFDDDSQIIWIGSTDSGLYYYKLNENKLVPISDSRLYFHPILSIESLNSSYLIIGTDGYGMCVLNKSTFKIEIAYNQYGKADEYLSGDAVYNLYKDSSKKVWISTYSDGAYMFNYSKHGFNTITQEKGNANSLSRNVVCDILEDSNNQIWFATNNDLSVYDKTLHKWKYLLNTKNILTLYEDSKKNIWVGTYSSGVFQLDKNGNILRNYVNKKDNKNSLGTNFIYSIIEDANGNIWFGGKRGVLSKLDTEKQNFTQIDVREVNHIINKDDRTLMISTENGVFGIDINSNKYKGFSFNNNLVSSYISDMYLESDTVVWLASYGDGINKCNIKTGTIERFTEKEGLSSNIIYALEVDDDNNLWFSSENGIGSLNMKTRNVTNFSVTDGISGNQFRQLSKEKNSEGIISFGSYDGVTYFNPKDIKKENRVGSLYLEEFKLFNKVIYPLDKDSPLNKPLNEIESIRLSYKQHSFSIGFSAIDFSKDKTRRYMWKLDGVDDNWIGPTSESMANYTNIENGDYLFTVKYLDDNSNVLDERTISVIISPPFWKTWWAQIIFTASLFLIAYSIYAYTKQQLKRKQAKEKIDFFINTAHDIRTPLTLISGPVYELKEILPPSNKTDYLLNLTISNLGKLNNIVTQLLDFQKVYSTKGQLVLRITDINKYLLDKIAYWQSSIQNKSISLNLEMSDISLEELIDAEKMDKILDNLASNAIKYTPDNGKILVKVVIDDKTWQVSFIDNGIGIPKQDVKNLFTKFYRASNAINSQQTGSGLGLLLIQKYVTLHKGKIAVKSTENQGSEFTVSFPRGKESYQLDIILDDNNLPIEDQRMVSEMSSYDIDSSRIKILIVEDNDDLRSYMKMSLSAFYSVFTAENGKVAWDNILKVNPDIVISDLQMPEMDGFELCKHIKGSFETSHIPMILLTVMNDPIHIAEGLNLNVDDYIEKPFDIKYLRLKINSIIQNRQMLRQKFLGVNTKDKTDSASVQYENELNTKFIDKVTLIIESNISDPNFTINDLSKSMNLSRTLLYSKFGAITGYTPNDFIKIKRMNKAIAYFKENKYTINEVALMVGFEEPAYFSTSFKRMYGKSPKQFIAEDLS